MRTVHLKKPTYVGAGAQIAAMNAEREVDGSFAEKKTAARIAAGTYLKGSEVAVVRIGDRRILVPTKDAETLGLEVENVATLASVDRFTGEVLLTIA